MATEIAEEYYTLRNLMQNSINDFYKDIHTNPPYYPEWYKLENSNNVIIFISPTSKSAVTVGENIIDVSITGLLVKCTDGTNKKLEIMRSGTVTSVLSATTSDPKDDYVISRSTVDEVNLFIKTTLQEIFES